MAFNDLLIHTVTIYNLTAGSTGRYGDETQTFDGGTSSAARVQQLDVGGEGREELEGRDKRTTTFEVFLPPSAVLNGLSHIVWGSRRMAVDGEPHLAYDGDGPHHYEVTTKEILGG